jgi:uncharacterized protein DUF3748/WD40 repeat protein
MQIEIKRGLLLYAGISLLCLGCSKQIETTAMKEIQLTTGEYGHTLNATQVFSPDDQWIVYDTRNVDTGIISTSTVERVHAETGKVDTVYTTENQTNFGPGVGAVAYHPLQDKIIFIHGLLNCNEQQPYGFARRFGAISNLNGSAIIHAEARNINEPLVVGALRGGTHAHTWSGDGAWISFTYNDYLMETLEKSTQGEVKDLRTIGVMAPVKKVAVANEDSENFSGEYFTVVAATVTEKPTPGSDEIERAFDECWIGNDGYIKSDGTNQKKAIAFQGNVRDAAGSLVTEVFISDVPDDIAQADNGKPLEGTLTTRPNIPKGLVQRRITYTADRKHPGLQGLRFRLRTSPNGKEVYFLMKDDLGIVQIFSVPTLGGSIQQITFLDASIQAQFNVSPDGKQLSLIADNSIWLIDIPGGKATRLTERSKEEDAPIGGAVWSHDGKTLAYNRYIGEGDGRFLQIMLMKLK